MWFRAAVVVLAVGFVYGCGGGASDATNDPTMKAINAQSTIYEAAEKGDLAAVTALIEAGSWDPSRVDGNGVLPLTYAAKGGNAEIIRLMIKKGANPNATDKLGSPIKVAQKAGKADAVAALQELGAKE